MNANAFVQARCRNLHEANWVTAFAAGKLLGVTKARVHQLMKDHNAYQLECFQLDGTGQWLITRDSLERLAAGSFGCSSGSDPTKATEKSNNNKGDDHETNKNDLRRLL